MSWGPDLLEQVVEEFMELQRQPRRLPSGMQVLKQRWDKPPRLSAKEIELMRRFKQYKTTVCIRPLPPQAFCRCGKTFGSKHALRIHQGITRC